jgi:hypothetical protein
MNYWEKKSDFKSLDYRSINFSGNWSKHFINDYVDSLVSKFKIGKSKSEEFRKNMLLYDKDEI